MKAVRGGTKRTPRPTPTRPPVIPPARQISTAASSLTVASSRQNQLHRDRDQEQGEEVGDGALGDPLLDRGAGDDAERCGNREQQRGADVDVAVEAALGERPEEADDHDRGEAGAGGEALAVAEPEDQQRHDDRPAADPEEAAEDAGEGADRRQLEQGVVRTRAGDHPAILRAVPGDSQTPERRGGDWAGTLAPLREEPGRAAVLTDVDGTLAPIVERAEEAAVPAAAREALAALSKRYALVGCISGRRAEEARRLVGLDSLAYAGNHGLELLMPGDEAPQPDPSVAGREREAVEFLASVDGERFESAGLRREDKGPIQALHWRGSADEAAAESRAHEIANEAGRAGLVPRWGRKVLELRPPGGGGKDGAVASLLADRSLDRATYAGDDRTDLDAFRRLRELTAEGQLSAAVCVGVLSAEGPAELAEECDVTVGGLEGWLAILEWLAEG